MTEASCRAEHFVEQLMACGSPDGAEKALRYFKTGKGEYGEGDVFIGVRAGQLASLCKPFIDLPPSEIEKLLESPIHEVRAGGLHIMAKQAAHKKTPSSRKKELFELYMRRTDRINNWDLVDGSARDVVGGYLVDKPRDILYKLARSADLWERRIAIVSTSYFIREHDLTDTFNIAEMLLNDKQDLIHKATGWMLREAGKKDRSQLVSFLDQHAGVMPRTLLRYAIEHFDQAQRAHYMGLKKVR
ncbi:DNA alkylation repair protein [Paenibacillus sp. 481]|uniref:DNA alkylation repair protein n=1 Tax=Paenibacillus sp. 481 TaxID=2835869 RepID=UPI001E5EBEE0|nr:DNA alkylation repair protein [Paenibacillus sp. 481]UHA72546.1 DNA alkylation repair protein [Paenibacillus sp. 481]